MAKFYIKTNRTFTKWREWAWIMTFVISVGGLFEPLLGMLVPGVILGLLVTSFFKGRYWCGNVCFHGSLYDRILTKVSRNAKIPRFFKSKLLILAGVAFFAYRIGSRLFSIFTSQLDTLTTLDRVGAVFVSVYWMVLFVSVPLGILFSSRTWCQFCPMGTFQRLSYKLGKILGVNKKTDTKISIESKALCHSCAKCSRVCPMQLTPYLEFDENNQFNSDKCIKCQTCVHNCPAEILSLKNARKATESTHLIEQTLSPVKPEYAATIQDLTLLEENFLEIVFALESPDFKFIPGQFILVRIQDHPKMNRAFTISKYDANSNTLRVTIKKVPNGYGADILFNTFKVGDKVMLEGPLGHELIVDKTANNLLLVAGGIGITPFIPIVEDLASDVSFNGSVHLIYGVNKENELIYSKDIEAIVESHPHIKFTPVVAFDENYRGAKGFVTNVIEKLSLQDTKIYMCGPKPMVVNVEKMLNTMNFNKDNLFMESA